MIDKLLKRHAKHFAGLKHDKKMLAGIHYHENGSIYVTNSHMLLAIKDVHQEPAHTVHATTNKKLEGNYPSAVTHLVDADYSRAIDFNFEEVKSYIGLIETASKIDEVGCLSLDGGYLELFIQSTATGESFKLKMCEIGADNIQTIAFLNVNYLYRVLKVFKDAGAEQVKLQFNDSKVRPLSFVYKNIEIILMPVRRYY